MSRSNYNKPFYVDVGTSIVAVRCASNHDVVLQYDHSRHPSVIELAETVCDRMNKEAEIGRPRRNCDVGTAEEQAERYGRYCDQFTRDGLHCENCPCCGKIPFGKCEFAWAQMPYEKGGAS